MRKEIKCLFLVGYFLVIQAYSPGVSMAREKAVGEMTMEEVYAMSLEDLVNVVITTSTLTEKALVEAPSTMTLVTEAEIRRSGATSLFELLEEVAGIDIRHYFGQGIKSVSLRGISTNYNKVKFLIDGHTINEPMWGNHFYDTPLENVEQIEIVRGPGSALFGTDAFAGIINVITKKPEDINGTRVDIKYGSNETKHADITFGKVFEDLSLGINVSYEDADDYGLTLERDQLYGTPLSLAPSESGSDERKLTNGSLYLEYKNLSLDVFYHDGEVHSAVPTAGFLTQDGEHKEQEYGYIEAEYAIPVSDTLEIKTKLSYDRIEHSQISQAFPDGFAYGVDSETGIPTDINGDGVPEYWPDGMDGEFGYDAYEYRGEMIFDYEMSENNTVLFGLFYEYLETKDNYVYCNCYPPNMTYAPHTTYTSDDLTWNVPNDRTVYGFFVQDEWDLTEEWYLVLGGRYDKYNDFGSTFNPRCGLVWIFDRENAGIMKLMYGTAFKAPVFSQLYHNQTLLKGNEDLDPERLTSYEASLGYVFQEKLKTTLCTFALKTRDVIDTAPVAGTPWRTFDNMGKTEALGIELEAKYEFAKNNDLYFGYTYTDAKNELTDEDQEYVSQHMFSCGLNFHLLDYLNWNINLHYTGEQPREAGDARDDLEAETVVNTTLRVENYKGWDLYFTVHNVFDEEVVSPTTLANAPMSDIPEPGRHYTCGITHKF